MIRTTDGELKQGQMGYWLDWTDGKVVVVTVLQLVQYGRRWLVTFNAGRFIGADEVTNSMDAQPTCYSLFMTADAAHKERLKRQAQKVREAEAVLAQHTRDTDVSSCGPVG